MPALRRLVVSVAFASLLVGFAAPTTRANPIALQTPAGLNPGDTFRFVWVTNGQLYGNTGTINALSSDIADYNAFVNSEAAGATYGGATVTWKAIGSTAAVNARDNVGGYNTLVPIYLVDGTRVANDLTENTDGFWSSALVDSTTIHLSIDGTDVNSYVWTGSHSDGTTYVGYELGSGADVGYGDSTQQSRFLDYDTTDGAYKAPMFVMSATLTVGGPAAVPEIDPAGMASVLALLGGGIGLLERRRRRA